METKTRREMEPQVTTEVAPVRTPDPVRSALRKRLLRPFLCSILAAAGIFGGISSLFVGLICVIIHALVPGDTVFDRAGTAFLIVAIPAILLGSVFLDEIQPKK